MILSLSQAFKPPCPWTMAIMNVLAELHQEPELKLNLKFEIEVLCKNLSIDVTDLKPSHYLKDPASVENMEYQLSQPKKKDLSGGSSIPSTPQTPGKNSDFDWICIHSFSTIKPYHFLHFCF